MAKNKLREFMLDKPLETTQQRNAFKSMLSQTQSEQIEILDNLSKASKLIFDKIEISNKSYRELIDKVINSEDLTNSDLEKLV